MYNNNIETLRQDCSNLSSLTEDALFDIQNQLRIIINFESPFSPIFPEYVTLYNKICDEIFRRGLV